jgi:sulfoxide reductase catalytic subunit YedY
MNYFIRKTWDLPQRLHTPEEIYRKRTLHRRNFLAALGRSAAGAGLLSLVGGCNQGSDEEVIKAGNYESAPVPVARSDTDDALEIGASEAAREKYPAPRNEKFTYGRDETPEIEVARYTNFYEFSTLKSSWRYVGNFQPSPWTVEVGGLCAKPATFDLDDIYRRMPLEERHYRHRCVETWTMCVPWTGFPLRELLKVVEPKPEARFVAFETFDQPEVAPHRAGSVGYPWPYTEGLTMEEATNELVLLATGMYGHPLLKQNGAPIRLVVPWKYGYKSIKSIVRITLTESQPATFWNTIQPDEYDFGANVNPDVPHPRWSQRSERMLGTGTVFDTILYNGYGEYVNSLYAKA